MYWGLGVESSPYLGRVQSFLRYIHGILDGYYKHIAHVWWKISLYGRLSIYSNALSRSNNRDCYLRTHLFLSYHLIKVLWICTTNIWFNIMDSRTIRPQCPKCLSDLTQKFKTRNISNNVEIRFKLTQNLIFPLNFIKLATFRKLCRKAK